MKIDVQSYMCHTYSESYEEHQIIWDILKYYVENVQFINKKTGLSWDGLTSIYIRDFNEGSFPTGLLERVIKESSKYKDFVLEVVDSRIFPQPHLDVGEINLELRDYQSRAINSLTFENRVPSFCKASCGAGKSPISLALFAKLRVRTLVIVDRIFLLDQLAESYKKFAPDVKISKMGDGKCEYGGDLTIAIIKTISSKLKKKDPKMIDFITNVECIVTDESHHAISQGYLNVLEMASTPYRYGMSATPGRSSQHRNLLVEGVYGPYRLEIFADDLMKEKFLSEVYATFVPINHPSGKKIREIRGRVEAKDRLVYFNNFRNKEICRIAKMLCDAREKPIIMFRIKKHGDEIKRVLKETYPELSFGFMHGETGSISRKEVVQKYISGEIDVIITSFIFGTGVSIDSIKFIIFTAGEDPKGELIQISGRTSRTDDGKKAGVLIDFDDLTHKKLTEDSNSRKATIRSEPGYKIIPWESIIGN